MVLISLGTGLGAGIIINGKLLRGAQDSAGEIGFLSSVQDVTRQPTNVGPLEARVSGTALEQHGDPRQIFARARNGDNFAQGLVSSIADGLGVAVANVFALLDPELVVLGGWIPRERDLLLDRVCEVAARLAPGAALLLWPSWVTTRLCSGLSASPTNC
jgi:predicted NBD/HSP70 family sugar kinase